MKPQDQELANIAEAAKRVMNKETEVQPKDKDFVDLHSIDKEKRRGSTPLTEKDIEEANEFTKAAAKAAVAGDDEFEFDGKKYPTEMDVEVAKKILGESTDLDEATTKVNGKNLSIEKPKKKGGEYKVTYGKETWHVNKDGEGSTPSKYFDSEVEDALLDLLPESTELDEASIKVDFMYPKAAWFKKLLKKYRLKMKIVDPGGGDGGTDVIKLDGKKKDIMGILIDPKGFDEYGYYSQGLAKNIEESTAEYAKSLEKIANDRKMKNLSKEDKATLMKIAAMMAKEEVDSEETPTSESNK